MSSEHIKKTIEEYISLGREIAEVKATLKVKSTAHKKLEAEIMEFMDSKSIGRVQVPEMNSEVMYLKKKVKEPMTKKVYVKYLESLGKNPDEEYEKINSYRGTVEKTDLKIAHFE